MNYGDIAYMTSIIGSSMVTILNKFPNNRLLYSKYFAIIMAIKSLIFVDMNLSDIVYHFLTLILCLYYLYYTFKGNVDFIDLIEEVYIVQQINISSIILGIRHFKKNPFIDFSFFLTFGYCRGILFTIIL